MTDEEIKKLAAEIVTAKGGFYVEPEEHYNQHQRIEKLLDIIDSSSNIIIKTVLGFVVMGAFALAVLGFGWHKLF